MYLSNLDDPLDTLALGAVADKLGQLVEDSESEWSEAAACWGVAPKYRTAEEDHHIEVASLLLGSIFVLGQAAISQTVSAVTFLYNAKGRPSWLPNRKPEIMTAGAEVHTETGLSQIVLVDAVANYFKHCAEWPPEWHLSEVTTQQRRTIEPVTRLGLSAETRSENLIIAARSLGFEIGEMSALGACIQAWRERLARQLGRKLEEHGV